VLKQFERFQAPFASMVHDFMATRDHVLFPILPLTGNMERARRGMPPFAWSRTRARMSASCAGTAA
jgi:carotenoid cleavage dioxygenase-like enzyme